MKPELIVITGPTASGKTALAIEVAERLGCDIISADSRQIYRYMPIGTACPTPQQLARVSHHFVQMLEPDQYYSAACFEEDAMRLLPGLFAQNERVVVCGGSMMYIDALCNGIDNLPTISDNIRNLVADYYRNEGLEGIRSRLAALDPEMMDRLDPKNPRRNIHALEICLQAGVPCSSLLTGKRKERPFSIRKFAIVPEREVLFNRISNRVENMIADGLVDEARALYPLRHLNSLNTVGYKELFNHFDGYCTLDEAVEKISRNTRVYAKKQLTWLKRAGDATEVASVEDIFENLGAGT